MSASEGKRKLSNCGKSIPAPVAKQLLVSGFLNEVVDRLDHPAISALVHDLIEANFARR